MKQWVVRHGHNTVRVRQWILNAQSTSNYEVAKWIEDNLDFDQLILEFYTPGIPDSGWVHVSYKVEGNRKSVLTAMREDGKTVYKTGLIE